MRSNVRTWRIPRPYDCVQVRPLRFTMENQRPKDIGGFEYDWLACDASGRAAFFSTAGGGYAPRGPVEGNETEDRALDAILPGPPTPRGRFAPQMIARPANTSALVTVARPVSF